MNQWHLAWKFNFRSTGALLAFIAGLVLLARLLISLARMDLAESSFNSFEVVIPLIAGLHAALLFAPDDEPALELLLASPRPASWLIYERVLVLTALQGGIALVLTFLTVILTPSADFTQIMLRWLPPSVGIVGLCMLATLYARRSAFGVLTAIAICVAMAFGKENILPIFPNLWFAVFYVDPGEVTVGQYLINRLFLFAVGVFALGLVLYRMRNHENLLGFQEIKNG